jgi:hypothetical protein
MAGNTGEKVRFWTIAEGSQTAASYGWIFRINVLETTLKQKTAESTEEKEKFHQLKEDFKYNLKLLEQRDKDLEHYETIYSSESYCVTW